MKKLFISMSILFSFLETIAQDKYIVFLKDKNNNPYSIDNPSAYLSAKAIERRQAQGISIDLFDIPITPSYLNSIQSSGVSILNKSKWLNTVTVQTTDTSQIIAVGNLPFVDSYKKVYGSNLLRSVTLKNKFTEEQEIMEANSLVEDSDYGLALNQTKMIKADAFHNAGYKGEGITIAVLDAGFTGTDTHPAFEQLRNDGRIIGTYDFVNNNSFVYGFSNHGTSVLSLMAADVLDSMIGTAPKANYYLLRSEDADTEFIIEEYNWAAAAEYADSVGVDIINSSLGYTVFNASSQNHTYQDMDGNTTPVTKAANMATLKGILVVNSAGNSGNDSWFYISAPADGMYVLSIGALEPNGIIASFSSRGPTADGRIKPNMSAQGAPAFLARAAGGYAFGNGTSFSSPIMAGFSACYWQFKKTHSPNISNFDIMDDLTYSCSFHVDPDNNYGYGIPNGELLLQMLSSDNIKNKTQQKVHVFPNPIQGNELKIEYKADQEVKIEIHIFNSMNQLVLKKSYSINPKITQQIVINNLHNLSPGVYWLKVNSNTSSSISKFIR